MQISLFCYRAKITSVYDGDTCTADIDLGLSTWVHGEKLRLYRINTPELRGPEREQGIIARDFVRNLILGKEVIVQTIVDKKGKFGRYLAEIWVVADEGRWINVNDHLIEKGYAEYYQEKVQAVTVDLNTVL